MVFGSLALLLLPVRDFRKEGHRGEGVGSDSSLPGRKSSAGRDAFYSGEGDFLSVCAEFLADGPSLFYLGTLDAQGGAEGKA